MLNCYIRHRMADKQIDDITELMKISNVSRNTINKLFRGNSIETLRLDSIIKLCNALNCKLSDLIEYTPDN